MNNKLENGKGRKKLCFYQLLDRTLHKNALHCISVYLCLNISHLMSDPEGNS